MLFFQQSSGAPAAEKMTPQERLKRKMQLLLNKQCKFCCT